VVSLGARHYPFTQSPIHTKPHSHKAPFTQSPIHIKPQSFRASLSRGKSGEANFNAGRLVASFKERRAMACKLVRFNQWFDRSLIHKWDRPILPVWPRNIPRLQPNRFKCPLKPRSMLYRPLFGLTRWRWQVSTQLSNGVMSLERIESFHLA